MLLWISVFIYACPGVFHATEKDNSVRIVLLYFSFCCRSYVSSVFVGPCHHGMARPQVVDGGTASDMEGSCE